MLQLMSQVIGRTANTEIKTRIVIGNEALILIDNEAFIAAWNELYADCPWATVFQSYEFVSTWYKLYNHIFMPVLALCYDNDTLVGLLALNQLPTKVLTGAGNDLAEYQVWISQDDSSKELIIESLLSSIRVKFPKCYIHLKYIPDTNSIDCLNNIDQLESLIFIKQVKQPLINLDKELIGKELRKKNRREKFNRLNRLGKVTFEKIEDEESLNSIIDELCLLSDFRKEAIYNKAFFCKDSLRKIFLLKLFNQGILHVTTFKVDSKIIACNCSIMGRGWVHLQGLNSHLPTFSKFSPGILHFLKLADLLVSEGQEIFDLTPGKDPYKDILATSYKVAYEVLITDNKLSQIKHRLKFNIKSKCEEYISHFDIKHNLIRRIKYQNKCMIDRVNNGKLYYALSSNRNNTSLIDFNTLFNLSEPKSMLPVAIDSLDDHSKYDSAFGRYTRWEYIKKANKNFELGKSSFTIVENGVLKICIWFSLQNKKDHPGDIILCDLYHNNCDSEFVKSFFTSIRQILFKNYIYNKIYINIDIKDFACIK